MRSLRRYLPGTIEAPRSATDARGPIGKAIARLVTLAVTYEDLRTGGDAHAIAKAKRFEAGCAGYRLSLTTVYIGRYKLRL